MNEKTARWAVVTILAAFVLLGLGYAFTTPTMEAPDEIHHYNYIRSLVNTGRPPVLGAEGKRNFGHHAPVYYVIGALATFWVGENDLQVWPTRVNPSFAYRFSEVGTDNKNLYMHPPDDSLGHSDTWLGIRVVRIVSVLMVALTLWMIYGIGREIFPEQPELAVGMVGLCAFIPEFLFIAGAVNDDNAATLFGALTLWMMMRIMRRGPTRRRCIVLGLGLGLGYLSKLTTAVLVPMAAVALWLACGRSWRDLLRWGVWVFGIAGILVLPWMIYQTTLYQEPTGTLLAMTGWNVRSRPASLADLGPDLYWLWTSFWGRLAYHQIPLANWIYSLINLVAAIALLGLLRIGLLYMRSGGLRSPFSLRMMQYAVMTSSLLLTLGPMVVRRLLRPTPNVGRYLFPVIAAIALLLVTGLAAWLPRRWHARLTLLVTVASLILGIAGLTCFLGPAYAMPEQLSEADVAGIPNRLDVDFGGTMRLLGYDLETTSVQPGDALVVTLFWEALAPSERDCTVFVHLLGVDDIMVAQRDTYPGLGRLGTSWLEPGYRWADRVVLQVPDTAYAPDQAYLQVGIFDTAANQRLAASGANAPIEEDAVFLGQVAVQGHPGGLSNPVMVRFAGQMTLVGYELSERTVDAGETLTVTLYWEGERTMAADYVISVQLVDLALRKAAQQDSQPAAGLAPTSTWAAGEQVVDSHALAVNPYADPGVYGVWVTVYAPAEGGIAHLQIVSEAGEAFTDYVVLTNVRVR